MGEDRDCRHDNKYIDNEETAKAVLLEAATSNSKIYTMTLFKAIDDGVFETMKAHTAIVEMVNIKEIVKLVKYVLKEISIIPMDAIQYDREG